jgi:hypothetical protein
MAKRFAIIAAARAGRDSQLTFAVDDLEKPFAAGLSEPGKITATNLAKKSPHGRPPWHGAFMCRRGLSEDFAILR